jgi:probable phosphoglycerate mutase
MVTKTIYLIRHGQTDYNKQGIVQGSGVDTNLNETGILQAKAFYQSYHHIPFEIIYTSNLQRTHQTVEPFKIRNIPTEILPELNEINWGELEGKIPSEFSKQQFYQQVKRWREGHLNESVNGGETPLQMHERQKRGLQKIEANSASPILICMHGRAMRGFLCLLTGQPLSKMDNFPHDNLSLYILEKTLNDTFYSIKTANSLDHLQHI